MFALPSVQCTPDAINSPAAKDPVPPCVLVCMTLFGNGYILVLKCASDKYRCNETDKNSGYFQYRVAKLIQIMQKDVFVIVFSKCAPIYLQFGYMLSEPKN